MALSDADSDIAASQAKLKPGSGAWSVGTAAITEFSRTAQSVRVICCPLPQHKPEARFVSRSPADTVVICRCRRPRWKPRPSPVMTSTRTALVVGYHPGEEVQNFVADRALPNALELLP